MARINTSKIFQVADRKQGNVVTGADFVMIIGGYEHLTFSIKTNSLPMLKNEKVEYTTTHGVKSFNDGYLQTFNDLPVSFMERDSVIIKNTIEAIQLSDENDELEIVFLVGRTLEDMQLWGVLKNASIFIEDNPEADSESTTSPFTISANVAGHYYPNEGAGILAKAKAAINVFS
ncbi:hypothetical protein MNB_SUP05-5-912 [hydrothermal vent metagenome]|uniref:Uncharacterized protein n=1 Tax=hydrothermal vent metagenome TaxID=652676 RepID=A0A1W1BRH5_9ZZZZ